MAYDERGKRDGTGPYRDSAVRSAGTQGRRQASGLRCPFKITGRAGKTYQTSEESSYRITRRKKDD